MNIVEKIEDFFGRQHDWLRFAIDEYAGIETELAEETYDTIQARLESHNKHITAFENERKILSREWQAAFGITESDRAAVKALAHKTEKLAAELIAIHASAAVITTKAAEQLETELAALHKGKSMLEGYRTGDSGGVHWLDRKG